MTLSQSAATPGLQRGRLNALFMINGLMYASWAVQIPAVQATLHLDTIHLSALLFTVMGGNLLALPIIRATLIKRGARVASLLSLLLLCAPLTWLAFGTSVPGAFVAALLYGIGFGGMDFTLNAVGGWLQDQLNRPIMSGLHAGYSVGALLGAVIGAGLIRQHLPLSLHLTGISVLGLLLGLICVTAMPGPIDASGSPLPTRPPALLLLLLIPGFFAAYAEGSITDWSTLYLSGVTGAPQATASLGFVLFSGLMVLGRFAGDRLTARFGTQNVVLGGGVASTAGFALVTLADSLAGKAAGFGLVGAGLSILAPLTFSAAWRLQGSAGIALLTAVFYGGFLAAPPLTGLIAVHFQLGRAFTLPLLLALVSVVVMISRPLYRDTPEETPVPAATASLD